MKQKAPTKAVQDDEILQRAGEDPIAYALRIVEMNRRVAETAGRPVISQKSFVRKQRELQKRLEHSFGAMRKGSDPPIDTESPAFMEHMRKITERREKEFEKGPMRWMASLEATGERAARDPAYKKALEERGFDRLKMKPWRGRVGNAARTAIRTKGKTAKREQAIALQRKGHTEVEIGKIIDRDPRTVRRYLNGR